MEDAAGRARADGDRVGAAHLPEHLRLADDQRVERRGDAEDVAHGLLVRVRVEVAGEEVGGDFAHAGEEVAQARDGLAGVRALGRGQKLDAVARRDDQALAHHLAVHERAQVFGARLVGERKTLAHLDGRGLVIQSDEQNGHGSK